MSQKVKELVLDSPDYQAMLDSSEYKASYGWELWNHTDDCKPDENLYEYIAIISERMRYLPDAKGGGSYHKAQFFAICQFRYGSWLNVFSQETPHFRYWMAIPTPAIFNILNRGQPLR